MPRIEPQNGDETPRAPRTLIGMDGRPVGDRKLRLHQRTAIIFIPTIAFWLICYAAAKIIMAAAS